jgi:dephospho-CoA kinase
MHPRVHQRRRELLAEAGARGDRIVVSDIPLLFEAGDPEEFDAVVLVDAPEPVRRQRLLASRALSEADADRLLKVQLPATAKRLQSDYVIDNDGDLASLERSAAAVWQALAARA